MGYLGVFKRPSRGAGSTHGVFGRIYTDFETCMADGVGRHSPRVEAFGGQLGARPGAACSPISTLARSGAVALGGRSWPLAGLVHG